jgi:hypothetical protein
MLHWTKDNKYYKCFEQPTLFGTIDVICVWGRIGGNLGGYKIIPCDTEDGVESVLKNVKKRRVSHGYEITE